MPESTEIETLLHSARAGDMNAENNFYELLSARFSKVIIRKLCARKHLLTNVDMDKAREDICRRAIQQVKRVNPLSSPNWSLKKAMSILHNVIDDFIANELTALAQKGDKAAESALFSLLREKLMDYVQQKRWRKPGNADKRE